MSRSTNHPCKSRLVEAMILSVSASVDLHRIKLIHLECLGALRIERGAAQRSGVAAEALWENIWLIAAVVVAGSNGTLSVWALLLKRWCSADGIALVERGGVHLAILVERISTNLYVLQHRKKKRRLER